MCLCFCCGLPFCLAEMQAFLLSLDWWWGEATAVAKRELDFEGQKVHVILAQDSLCKIHSFREVGCDPGEAVQAKSGDPERWQERSKGKNGAQVGVPVRALHVKTALTAGT